MDPRFAFWRYPRRIERLAIHVLVLDEQLAQLGQTVGGLVADKREARDAELNGAFLDYEQKFVEDHPDGSVRTKLGEWRQIEAEKEAALQAEEDAAGIIRTPEPAIGFIDISTPSGEDQRGA